LRSSLFVGEARLKGAQDENDEIAMIDRLEILASKLRYQISRNRWTARLLGYPFLPGHGDDPGLILLQIDGLGEDVLRRAMEDRRMPFLRHLIRDEGYRLHTLYTGMPSSTPGFQAELFYGIPTAVPAFAFRDRESGTMLSLGDPEAASTIEARLRQRGRGLLRGGSVWSTIFSGDADEARLCASTVGLGPLLRSLNPLRLLAVLTWHLWSVLRVAANMLIESGLAFWDFLRGGVARGMLLDELRFVPMRVAVTAGMREIVTAGACVDAERGLPIIYVNYLGYDEHAHRRGPKSRFALWTLRGIDRSVRRVWLAAHRSRCRDYQVWILSDHGQERTLPYPRKYGESVADAVRRVYREVHSLERIGRRDLGFGVGRPQAWERSRWLGPDLPDWVRASREDTVPEQTRVPLTGEEPWIVHKGPVGFVYLPEAFDMVGLRGLAEAICEKARIPLVLVHDGEGGAWVWRSGGGRFHLPEDAAEVFGADHPHLKAVTEDTLNVVCHESAGAIVIMGWNRDEPLSLQMEKSAHGGPGPRETSAILLLPPELLRDGAVRRALRPLDLRELVLRVLDGAGAAVHVTEIAAGSDARVEQGEESRTKQLRVMTYNVHGCRGMDGKYSPQRIARVIARLRPDIVCLQELDQDRGRSGGVNQVEVIAARLQADYRFHSVRNADDGRFGNAVLTSLPMRLVESGELPRLRRSFPLEDRGVLWVAIDIGDSEIHLFNTHLSILRKERRLQVRALLSEQWLLHPDLNAPVLLAGDLNTSSHSWTARQIGELLQNAVDPGSSTPLLRTWSSRLPLRRIDHVFASREFTVFGLQVPRTRLARVASDHLPLVVDFGLRRPVQGTSARARSPAAGRDPPEVGFGRHRMAERPESSLSELTTAVERANLAAIAGSAMAVLQSEGMNRLCPHGLSS
jgi:endonuclease/exonuclease/phosphatase family metal-dependent hydrolase